MDNRLKRDFFDRDADVVAKELLGKKLVIKACGGCNFEWRIIETEAYKEEENQYGEEICHIDDRMKSSGFIFTEGNNGLIITCDSGESCDNVLIRGLLTVFNSRPYLSMFAFSMNGYFGSKSNNTDTKIDLNSPVDLCAGNALIYLEDDASLNYTSEPICSTRIGLEEKSEKRWNFRLLDFNRKTVDTSLLNLND